MAPLLDYFNLFIYFILQDYIHHLLTDLMILWIYVINTLFTMYPRRKGTLFKSCSFNIYDKS